MTRETGTVIFYSAAKGFGFIATQGINRDIFVHHSILAQCNVETLLEGDTVSYRREVDSHSGKPCAFDLVVTKTNPAASPLASMRRSKGEPVGEGVGTVKWFNESKGFGFIVPQDGGKDIFVHVAALNRSGLKTLSENQPIAFVLRQSETTGKVSATDLRILG